MTFNKNCITSNWIFKNIQNSYYFKCKNDNYNNFLVKL